MESRAGKAAQQLINPLPNDLALLILARLPWSLLATLRCVCQAWRYALQPSAMIRLRDELGFSQAFPLLYLYNPDDKRSCGRPDGRYLLFDPLMYRHYTLPPLQGSRTYFPTPFAINSSEIIALTYSSKNVFSTDVALSIKQWWPRHVGANPDFGGAAICFLDGYLYMAGGLSQSAAKRLQINGESSSPSLACSSSSSSSSSSISIWESLPGLREPRKDATGFVYEGCFCVVGGRYYYGREDFERRSTGEMWNPSAGGVWTLVPELWPAEFFEDDSSRPQIAVVRGRLYALSTICGKIMYYENGTKRWLPLCDDPGANISSGKSFFAVGDTFWVGFTVDDKQQVFIAAVPSDDCYRPLVLWRNFPFKGNFRFLNCVVSL